MGSSYSQLTLEERCEIARLREGGQSNGQIAAALGRSSSSIGRELKRNTGSGPRAGAYRPAYAQEQTRARRWSGSRLEREEVLRETVLGLLSQGWSPEQVVGRLKRQEGRTVIGVESIYRFIYAQLKRSNDGAWRNYLPRAKYRRGRRGQKGGSPALHIKERVGIDQRPEAAADRAEVGHWEADFMLFSRYGQSVLVLHERTSRLTVFLKTDNRKAEPTAQLLRRLLEPLPPPLRRTLTFDNGTEFAEHHSLNPAPLGLATYFCDPHSPWQKGGARQTPSAASGASCQDARTSTASTPTSSSPPSAPSTTSRDSVWTIAPRPRSSPTSCCTSNGNPHPDLRRDEREWG
jgi:IS30 family transposase